MRTVFHVDGVLGSKMNSALADLKIQTYFCFNNIFKEPDTFKEPFARWKSNVIDADKYYTLKKLVLEWQLEVVKSIEERSNKNAFFIVENSFMWNGLELQKDEHDLIELRRQIDQIIERANIIFDYRLVRKYGVELINEIKELKCGPPNPSMASWKSSSCDQCYKYHLYPIY